MNNNNSSARLVFTNFIFKIMDSRREKKGVGDSPNVIVVSLFKKLIYFLAVLGLLFSICGKAGISRAVMLGLLVVVASLVVEHRLWAHGLKQLWHTDSVVAAHGPQSMDSVFVVHGLSCSAAWRFSWTRDQTCVPCTGK